MTHSRFDHQFQMSVAACNDEVRVLLHRLRKQLSDYGVSDETCATAEIVLAEALNNITEHAFAGREDGTVQILTQISASSVTFTLDDHGNALPGHRLPKGTRPETAVPLQDLPEGGFGWFLIRDLTSSVSYDRDDDGNHLVMTLPIK